MSSKAEKTSQNLPEQHRLSIFFRNITLLKIVAWLGSLSFIGATGVVWADLKPISASQTETQTLLQTSAGSVNADPRKERDLFGPQLPTSQRQSPAPVTAEQLPNREVPIAVTPASASILPSGKIGRPQHTDLLTADNYTVGVNGSGQTSTEEFITIPVPPPLHNTIPRQNAELVTTTSSRVQPSYVAPQSAISQSVPTTSIHRQPLDLSDAGYRPIPAVPSLPTKLTSQQVGHSGANGTTPLATGSRKGIDRGTPISGLKPTVVQPLKPAVTAVRSQSTSPQIVPGRTLVGKPTETFAATSVSSELSIEIPIAAPRTQTIPVQAVAQLPQVRTKSVPTVPSIPTVRPAATGSRPVAYASNGTQEFSSELIYPLTSPAPTTSGFGWRTHPITGSRRFHSGLDIGAPMGAPVVAAGSGTIISAGWVGGYGKAIVIQHNGVQQTLYGHLSEVFVQPGQTIEQGTVIGRVGSTGNSTGPHLHFETRVSSAEGWVAVDPGDDIKYALDNLRRSMPFAQRDLPPGVN